MFYKLICALNIWMVWFYKQFKVNTNICSLLGLIYFYIDPVNGVTNQAILKLHC